MIKKEDENCTVFCKLTAGQLSSEESAEEIAQLLKSLLHNYEDLSLILSIQTKPPDTCKATPERPLGHWPASQPSLLGKLQHSERLCLKKQNKTRWTAPEEQH